MRILIIEDEFNLAKEISLKKDNFCCLFYITVGTKK